MKGNNKTEITVLPFPLSSFENLLRHQRFCKRNWQEFHKMQSKQSQEDLPISGKKKVRSKIYEKKSRNDRIKKKKKFEQRCEIGAGMAK